MDRLEIYILTFNCARTLIETDAFANHFFDGWEDPASKRASLPDVIVLNLQEISPISYAFLGNNFIQPYLNRFRQAVPMAVEQYSRVSDTNKEDYSITVSRATGLTALMIFTKQSITDDITSVSIAEVGAGLSEMANKGAIGARLSWSLSSADQPLYTTFVSAHLAPFEGDVQRRDEDYISIVKGLVFSEAKKPLQRSSREEVEPLLVGDTGDNEFNSATMKGIYADDSFLFFGGDLNYRTSNSSPADDDWTNYPQPRKEVKDKLHYSHLFERDQLTRELKAGRTLHGLTEQEVTFPPTYKYRITADKSAILDTNVDEWRWARHRWPSWCDRILFSSTETRKVLAGKYSALPIFRTSDHRPVALSASIATKPAADQQFASYAPTSPDPKHKARRDAARRKEIMVGLAAYLGLTWEGNTLLLGTVLIVLGCIWISRSIS